MIQVIYKIIQPSLHLRPFVKNYMLFHFVSDKNDTIPAKPFPANTEHCLVFYLDGLVTAVNPKETKAAVYPKIAINGSQLSRFDFHISHRFLLLSIQFQAGVLSKFLRLPLIDFTDVRIDAEAVLGSSVLQVHEEMANATSFEMIITLIEAYLWKRIESLPMDFYPMDGVMRIASENPAGLSIVKMASDSCLSISQFERRFVQQMGITPKLFVRINRFSKAYKMKEQHPSTDWLTIALETGYHDYQHLVKDFKQFAYATPYSLLLAQKNAPEKLVLPFKTC